MIQGTERLGKIAVIRKTAAFADLLYSAARMQQKSRCLLQPVFQEITDRGFANNTFETAYHFCFADGRVKRPCFSLGEIFI